MRTFWSIPFSDLIVILGIIITIGLAGIILRVELTIKRRWDTLHLKTREFRKFRRKGQIRKITPYDNRYTVRLITNKNNLAAGKIVLSPNIDNMGLSTECGLSERNKQEPLPIDTMVIFDLRQAVTTGNTKRNLIVIIPYSAILAKYEDAQGLPDFRGEREGVR